MAHKTKSQSKRQQLVIDHRPTNISCTSTCRAKEKELNGLSGSVEMRDGIIQRGEKQKYSHLVSRRMYGIFYRLHTSFSLSYSFRNIKCYVLTKT